MRQSWLLPRACLTRFLKRSSSQEKAFKKKRQAFGFLKILLVDFLQNKFVLYRGIRWRLMTTM